jgi:hypothetical protein
MCCGICRIRHMWAKETIARELRYALSSKHANV